MLKVAKLALIVDGASVVKPVFGDIYLVRSSSIISRLVRFWTRSRFNHGGIVLTEKYGIEANWNGVRVIELARHENITYLRPKTPLASKELKALSAFIREKFASEYDYAGLLGFVLFKRLQDPDKYYCFELIFRAYEFTGRSLGRLDIDDYIDGKLIYFSLALEERRNEPQEKAA